MKRLIIPTLSEFRLQISSAATIIILPLLTTFIDSAQSNDSQRWNSAAHCFRFDAISVINYS